MIEFDYAAMRAEAERELMRRKRDYPARIARGRMKADVAARQIRLMGAIVLLLRELEKTELLFPY